MCFFIASSISRSSHNALANVIHFPRQIREVDVGKSAHSILHIMGTAEGDFGDYKCSASNILGVDDASLKLTGIPGQVSITSGTQIQENWFAYVISFF